MDFDEIKSMALEELLQRSFRLMRATNPEADSAFEKYLKLSQQLDELAKRLDDADKKLLEEFSASSSDAHSLELDHAYMQGARDCVALLRDLGVI